MANHNFSWCQTCGKTLYNPRYSSECAKCNKPYNKINWKYIDDNNWIAIRVEAPLYILVGTFESKEEAIYFAALDYANIHKQEALCFHLSTMIPIGTTKSDMLNWFYGIKINSEVERGLSIHGRFEENEIKWIIGKAWEILMNMTCHL